MLKANNFQAAVGTTDKLIRQVGSLVYETGEMLISELDFAELQKKHIITLQSGQEAYPLPADLNYLSPNTNWDQNEDTPMGGPLTPQEWTTIKEGIISTGPWRRFRVYGSGPNTFKVDPVPDTTGPTISFEYSSRSWIRPPEWVTGTAYTTGVYRAYGENIYQAASSGTAGATPPTHTTGTVSDGGVDWAFYGEAYNTFLQEEDETVIDGELLVLGTMVAYLDVKGLGSGRYQELFQREKRRRLVAKKGMTAIDFSRKSRGFLIGPDNVPDSGIGM